MTPAPLLDPESIEELPDLLAELGADGWLLFDFQDRNPVAHELLGLGKTTRRGFALFPGRGPPVALHHPVDRSSWAAWPWERRSYAGWRELEAGLGELLEGIGTVAVEVSPTGSVPTVDLVPAGIAELVSRAGPRLVSSADLVTAFYSRWSPGGLELHREAARRLREIAQGALQRAGAAAWGPDPLREAELGAWIRARLGEEGLTAHGDCIVAAGPGSSDPHYEPVGSGALLGPDTVVLLDLWGGFPDGGIPADQTWMAYLGATPPDELLAAWGAVRDARDRALSFLRERAADGVAVRGCEVDDVARRVIDGRGYGPRFVHRLGHSIDRRLHGAGPNLDNLETRDERRLIPGVGFSVEPGVYLTGRFGVRSEVNVHWGEDGPEVTPEEIQRDLLLFPGEPER